MVCQLTRGLPHICLLLYYQKWIRTRARQGGIPRPVSVELVSALKGWGVEELLVRLHREVGSTGDVWVVSAKS